MADKSSVGKKYPPFTWDVERGKIRELMQAIGDSNPIFFDRSEAIKEGYRDIPAPPTFITVPMQWTNLLLKALKDINANFAKVLHGEESYEYFKVIYPDDVLTGTMEVVSIDQKSGKSGDMDLIRLETMFTDQKGELVLKASTLIVERK